MFGLVTDRFIYGLDTLGWSVDVKVGNPKEDLITNLFSWSYNENNSYIYPLNPNITFKGFHFLNIYLFNFFFRLYYSFIFSIFIGFPFYFYLFLIKMISNFLFFSFYIFLKVPDEVYVRTIAKQSISNQAYVDSTSLIKDLNVKLGLGLYYQAKNSTSPSTNQTNQLNGTNIQGINLASFEGLYYHKTKKKLEKKN